MASSTAGIRLSCSPGARIGVTDGDKRAVARRPRCRDRRPPGSTAPGAEVTRIGRGPPVRASQPKCSTRATCDSARLFVRRHPRPQRANGSRRGRRSELRPRQQHLCRVAVASPISAVPVAGVLLAGWPPASPRRGVVGSADPFQPGTCSTAVMGGIPRQIRPEFEPCRECRCINPKRSRITASKE